MLPRFVRGWCFLLFLAANVPRALDSAPQRVVSDSDTTVAQLVNVIRAKAKALETTSGMRIAFQSFTSA
jgi:hypothetical protein